MAFSQNVGSHLKIAGGAVWGWLLAQFLDSFSVGILWFVGLLLIKMSWPLALLWAVVGAFCQFIPHLGPVLGLIGPGLTAAAKVTSHWEHYEQLLYVLILYAVIMVVDGLFLQPYFMRRQTKVPMWASILTPIVLGFLVPLWGVLLAPPLLAIIYAYKARRAKNSSQMPPRNISC
jgi:predicted PurR-regulated permease PerM